jgi:hypothetical protein
MTIPAASAESVPRSDRSRISALPVNAAAVIGAACGLVLLRALTYLLFEQFGFDSDQAINGLMAKHLSEGRAFPLFFYGQTYMLAVEAWVAVPFFWIAGPTVAALRSSLLAWNVAFAALLIVALQRDAGLWRWTAIVPALFFLAAPPSVAKQLMEAQGGIIEPFVYIGLLWFLRKRPLWFGAVLAIGFRNREFTIYAVPVLLTIELACGELTRARLREWLLALAMFLAVWESIAALLPFADLAGPGTRGQLLGGFSNSQIDNLVDRINARPAEMIERIARMGPALIAWFSGGAQVETSFALSDRPWLVWLAAAFAAASAARLLMLTLRGGQIRAQIARASFAWYALGVGIVAVAAFITAKPTLNGYSRYAILGLLIPVGLTAALLALEPSRAARRAVIAVVAVWAVLSTTDNVRLLLVNMREPPANPVRELAQRLIDDRVPVAAGGYWEAYITTFVARERVRVTSDFVRIQEYQDLFVEHLRDARVLAHAPCPGGEHVARWYLCSP